jgi:hypothetical protein
MRVRRVVIIDEACGYDARRMREYEDKSRIGRRYSLLRCNTASSTASRHTTILHCTPPTNARDAICCCMLRLRCGWQPTAARDALCFDEAVQYVFGDDEQVFDSSEAGVLFGRAAVDVRSTGRIVLDDGGSDFS